MQPEQKLRKHLLSKYTSPTFKKLDYLMTRMEKLILQLKLCG